LVNFSIPKEGLRLRFGITNVDEAFFIQRNVSQIEIHHSYDNPNVLGGYDIALLKLDRSINFQQDIIPICLPNQDESFIGKGLLEYMP